MKRSVSVFLALLLASSAPSAGASDAGFEIGVLAPGAARHPEAPVALRSAVSATDAENLAFVVSLGIRSRGEPCTEDLFQERHTMLQSAEHGIMVSLTAADWADCRNADASAGERLNRLRAQFFDGEFSLGGTRLPVLRQSASPQFRSYSENFRWELGNVLFATMNLPSDNNHYLHDAGRNSEFEDRQVANRIWLQRLFRIASYQNLSGIVLFVDADPLLEQPPLRGRDGYSDARRQLKGLAARFAGKVLVVSVKPAGPRAQRLRRLPRIVWSGNTGHIAVDDGWMKIAVAPDQRDLFRVVQKD